MSTCPGSGPGWLPIRPRPEPGESTLGFLMRVAGANGFASVRQLQTRVLNAPGGAFALLRAQLELREDEGDRLFGVLPRSWNMDAVPLGLATADFNTCTRRWCPRCLGAKPVIQGRWGLKLVCACHEHQCWLVDRCQRCDAPQSWAGSQLLRCACGAVLADAEPERCSAPELALSAAMGGELLSGLDTRLFAMSVAGRHRLVRYLGRFAVEPRLSTPGQQGGLHHLAQARVWIAGATALLAEWPVGFNTLLDQLRSQADISPSIPRTFGPIYRVLYSDLNAPEFAFLREQFECYLQAHWWGLVCRRNRRLPAAVVTSHPRVSLRQAAEATSVATAVVRHLVQADLLPVEAMTFPSGRHIRTMHAQQLASIADLVRGALNLKQASQWLGLPERRLRELVAAKLLLPLVDRVHGKAVAAWLFAKPELDRFLIGSRSADGAALVPLAEVVRYWRLSGGQFPDLVEAVRGGELEAFSEMGGPVPIGKARVRRTHVADWLRRQRSQQDESMTVDQASRKLGLKQQVVYELVRAGFLHAESDAARGWRVLPRSVGQFQAEFVSLAELARAAKSSPRSVLQRLPIGPACGPGMGTCRQYFFRRAERLQGAPT